MEDILGLIEGLRNILVNHQTALQALNESTKLLNERLSALEGRVVGLESRKKTRGDP